MIEIRGVTKRFGAFTAVDNVSLTVNAGEFITLLGPSGCGKTTLLRLLAGFETPDEGAVLLDGVDVSHEPLQPQVAEDAPAAHHFERPFRPRA